MAKNPEGRDMWDYLTGALLSAVWLYLVVTTVREYRVSRRRRACTGQGPWVEE